MKKARKPNKSWSLRALSQTRAEDTGVEPATLAGN